MAIRIGINGFGRLGRLVCRAAMADRDIELMGINDLVPPDNLAYLLKYDSVHGRADFEVDSDECGLLVGGRHVPCTSFPDPAQLPWKELAPDYVVEATGRFAHRAGASQHLAAGAKRVLITAGCGDRDISTLVMGVNHSRYDPARDAIVSGSSAVANALAPMVKVILQNFGVVEGLLTALWPLTSFSRTVDGPSRYLWQRGRAAGHNIIPATDGGAVPKGVGLCLPSVAGKLAGVGFWIPVSAVSVLDLTVRIERSSSLQDINAAMRFAAETDLRGILGYTEDAVVSSDFIHCPLSCTYDAAASLGLGDKSFKLIAWYDNEWGYACRVLDLLKYMAKQDGFL